MNLLLGCIADDLTGAADLALMLAQNRMPTTLCLGVPAQSKSLSTPATVVALKIRTKAAADAAAEATAAAAWLLDQGARQLYYKYCSTFDSTPAGNIGPVTEALLEVSGQSFTVIVPSFPENARFVKDGILYVDGIPLAESPMRHHPLTPMKESSLIRLMDAQTSVGSTGLVPQSVVDEGAEAVAIELQRLRGEGKCFAVIDAGSDADFPNIVAATASLGLLTGASGIAMAIPDQLRADGHLRDVRARSTLPRVGGTAAILAGSCSKATQTQIAAYRTEASEIRVDPDALFADRVTADELADRSARAAQNGNVLVTSTQDPSELQATQQRIGIAESAAIVEDCMGAIARRLADDGVRKFVVAGGETSGAVAKSLQLQEFVVGPQIDPGVPWMFTNDDPQFCVAFKSGNFGTPDFFHKALEMLP